MSVRASWVSLVLSSLILSILPGCQRSEPSPSPSQSSAAPSAAVQTPAPPPPPPEPPQTSLGKLVKAETASTTKVRVQYLTLDGLKSDVEELKASSGKVYVVLHFEGKPAEPKKEEGGMVTLQSGDDGRLEAKDNSATGEPNIWLTDAAGTKYSEWSSFWEKETGVVAFEVPAGVAGLVFHDGEEHAYPIEVTAAK